jgi:hypothetical protein
LEYFRVRGRRFCAAAGTMLPAIMAKRAKKVMSAFVNLRLFFFTVQTLLFMAFVAWPFGWYDFSRPDFGNDRATFGDLRFDLVNGSYLLT